MPDGQDRLSVLREKRDEALSRPFPLTADLPDEYDDLYAEWIELKNLVMAAVDKVLAGGNLAKTDMERNNLPYIRKRLRKLETAHPAIAAMYIEPFRVLEALLRLLTDYARGSRPKDS